MDEEPDKETALRLRRWVSEAGRRSVEEEVRPLVAPWTRGGPEPSVDDLWRPEVDVDSLFDHQPIPIDSMLRPENTTTNGEITKWQEIINLGDGRTNDLSMKRPPLPPNLATRGNPSRLPFLPACFLEEKPKMTIDDTPYCGRSFLGEKILHKVPILNIGINFNKEENSSSDNRRTSTSEDYENNKTLDETSDFNLTTPIDENNILLGIWNDSDDPLQSLSNMKTKNVDAVDKSKLEKTIVDSIANVPLLNISTHEPREKRNATEWVEILNPNLPVTDFEKRVPVMAHKYPFELDTFQKLAILKLEEQGHVFVAAHTSAGKTVVAEYAIALSLKHCTRVIYTSPVKALSNQKYREFTETFGDVGLITGDIQINTTASCLVMTTEILRSMLYYGSDVIRDLEYVIFDEVHYINDTQRGYVWEEILILLPSHCGIVMLSATVPNTLEFADWVGRTKKRMVYVVSTTKRPVALCHYLYTGMGAASKNCCFLILGPAGVFLKHGYDEAYASKISAQSKNQGFKRGTYFNVNQEKTMWIGIINYLKSHDKLPVVAFILSRKRCDVIAGNLKSQDLTTAKEKSKIHIFIQACLKKLNKSDQKLPQVTTLQTLLTCGIGVHHSGILPILKEVVEMLFQLGLVKILFATETFAVGVNMPARTVVFDSITKYDGMTWRSLMPSEYIQMAGRAGRRGLDDTGTVIILNKKEVPPSADLINMMLGKPTKLSSQFRVTYATMLSLLRVTNLSIESMMKCSFREFGVQTKTSVHKVEMQNVYQLLSQNVKTPNYDYLNKFADLTLKYYNELNDISPIIIAQKSKEIVSGRVVLINFDKYAYQFGIILGFTGTRSSDYRVLVLELDEGYYYVPPFVKNKNLWHFMLCFAGHALLSHLHYKYPNHTIITIKPQHILNLVHKKFNGDHSEILADYDYRIHRKKHLAQPSNTCLQAIQFLVEIVLTYCNKPADIKFMDKFKGLKINKGEIWQSLQKCDSLLKQLMAYGQPCSHHNFYREFPVFYERKQLEWKYEELERLLSSEEMSLYPEYQRRLQVLKELRYIDSDHHVAIKGRVACELGKNELMVTEIVFRNILTDLEPAEIAALLSCLVVEARIEQKTAQKIDERLQERIDSVCDIDQDLTELEKTYMVGCDDPTAQEERLNFGLVTVVYEWAKGKSFCDIITMTDVQEGIIVHSIQKLHEVLMNVRDVARIIGDPILHAKMDEASQAIKRDIVFAASLYTQEDINTNV